MTSGSFEIVPMRKIWVEREARQRRELVGIPDLADSIRRLGLINPLVITRDFQLRAGERRFRAIESLGWTEVPVQWLDTVEPTELLLIELEENIKRVDVTWQEQCLAIAKYHEIQKARDPLWSQEQTAEATGQDRTGVTNQLLVAEELLSGAKELVNAAPTYRTAVSVARSRATKRAEDTLQVLTPRPEREAPLLHTDFLEWVNSPHPAFNLIHCDFPYGINFQDHDRQGSIKFDEGYHDTFDNYAALCGALAQVNTAPSCHLLFWFSMEHYTWTYDCLTRIGWRVNKFPLIWSKGNTGLIPDPQRGPRRVYETCFLATKGDRKIVEVSTNHISFWDADRSHQSEKPRLVLEHFLKMLVDEYTVMLDPTSGSGNAVRVAQKRGAKFVLGLEKNPEFYNEACKNYWRD